MSMISVLNETQKKNLATQNMLVNNFLSKRSFQDGTWKLTNILRPLDPDKHMTPRIYKEYGPSEFLEITVKCYEGGMIEWWIGLSACLRNTLGFRKSNMGFTNDKIKMMQCKLIAINKKITGTGLTGATRSIGLREDKPSKTQSYCDRLPDFNVNPQTTFTAEEVAQLSQIIGVASARYKMYKAMKAL